MRRIVYRVVRYWTRYEINEVRLQREVLGYAVFLRRQSISIGTDCGYRFDGTEVTRHAFPFTEAELAAESESRHPQCANCYSTLEKALWGAVWHSLETQPPSPQRDRLAAQLFQEAVEPHESRIVPATS